MLVDRFVVLESAPTKEKYEDTYLNVWSIPLDDGMYAAISEVVTH